MPSQLHLSFTAGNKSLSAATAWLFRAFKLLASGVTLAGSTVNLSALNLIVCHQLSATTDKTQNYIADRPITSYDMAVDQNDTRTYNHRSANC